MLKRKSSLGWILSFGVGVFGFSAVAGTLDAGDGLAFVPGAYLTLDLASGAVTEETVSDFGAFTNAYDTFAYRTGKMAFRAIPSGAYAIGIFEVTAAQFARLVGERFDEASPRAVLPARNISWMRIRDEVLPRLNARLAASGRIADLPSEAQWERACRAGSKTKFYFSDDIVHAARYSHFRDIRPLPVGSKIPNGFGLYDMSGNVWEWTRDVAPGEGTARTLRGGSYDEYWGWGTSTLAAHRADPTLGHETYGFRLVLTEDRGGFDVSRLPAAEIDRGGLTFDFAAISSARFDADGRPTCDRALAASCFDRGFAAWDSFGDFPLALTERPFSYLDGRFAVSEGQCGMVQFGWKYRGAFDYKDHRNIRFEIELTKGYAFLGTNFGELNTYRTERRADGSTFVTLGLASDGMRPNTWMNNQRPLDILIAAEPGAGEGKLFMTVTDAKGKPISQRESVVLYTVPPVAAKAVPERFRYGLDTWNQLYFREDKAYDAIAGLLGGIGARWLVQDYRNQAFAKHWHRRTGGIVTPFWSDVLENGYHIGPYEGRPEEDRFVCDPDSKRLRGRADRVRYLRNSTCPAAVYEERPFFLTNTVAALGRILEGSDGMWANWEPSMFECNGCWCDTCKKEFAKFAKLSAAEVDAGWPREFEEGRTWYALGRKFRSWQHGKMVRTLDRHVRALTGARSVGLLPAVCHVEMSSYWRPYDYPGEVKPIDYAGDLEWINPWGPYCCWKAGRPFAPRRQVPLFHWASALDVRRTVDADYPAGKRPKLLAYPNGFQCGVYVSQPEHIAMAMDASFFTGWEACCVYFFPNGYDARYLKAYAKAVERAACAEKHVLDGRRADGSVTAIPVREYAVPVTHPSAWIPATTNVAMLQTAAFDRDGSRIVAALNFWDEGPAFFSLRSRDLPAGDYTVTADGVLYAKDLRHGSWTAEELAGGIDLVVGAARSVVFEIRPVAEGAADRATGVVTRAAIAALYGELRAELADRAARDAARERANGRAPWHNSFN